jgi:hypothetical protein
MGEGGKRLRALEEQLRKQTLGSGSERRNASRSERGSARGGSPFHRAAGYKEAECRRTGDTTALCCHERDRDLNTADVSSIHRLTESGSVAVTQYATSCPSKVISGAPYELCSRLKGYRKSARGDERYEQVSGYVGRL